MTNEETETGSVFRIKGYSVYEDLISIWKYGGVIPVIL
jgi:hypothetical protein